MDRQRFSQPPAEYRPIIFWSWNGLLERDRLLKQIRQMKAGGLGGFFMHARDGLLTPYLEEEWFECIRICIEEAKRLGMEAWIYDEKGWPSGFAGGIVPRKGRSLRAKALVSSQTPMEDRIDFTLLSHPQGVSGLYIYEFVSELGNPRFDGSSYVDLLNPEVASAFLECTYNRYQQEVGSEFGGVIPGIFSDEACVMMWGDPALPALPWTEHMEKIFLDTYGYDLASRLQQLFLPIDGYRKVRYDYWKLVVELFVHNFSKPLYEWCSRNGVSYTGHYMAEDHLTYSMEWMGDLMPHYEYMHIPGMDHLGRQIHKRALEFNEPYTKVLSAKQVTSIAHQFNKKRALSELFACTGQGFNLELQKWMTDWHFVHGINYFTPHLLPYSMAGVGKRDYPVTVGPQQPWWGYNHILTDYQGRMSYALTRGRRVTRLLIIHPMESAWLEYSPLEHATVDNINAELEKLSLCLLDRHLDFDLGNESHIEQYGSVRDNHFIINEAAYEGVIIPAGVLRLRQATINLMEAFESCGGRIWSDEPVQQLKHRIPQLKNIPIQELRMELLKVSLPGHTQIDAVNSQCIWVHERVDDSGRSFFLANTSLEQPVDAIIRIYGDGMPQRWNAENGRVEALVYTSNAGEITIPWHFPTAGSLYIRIDAQEADMEEVDGVLGNSAAGNETAQIEQLYRLSDCYSIVECDLNTVVLDYLQVFDDHNHQWDEASSIMLMKHHNILRQGIVKYRAAVQISEDCPKQSVYIVTEPLLQVSHMFWNGTEVLPSIFEWLDPGFISYDVDPSLFAAGENSIEFHVDGASSMQLENLYIVGPFQTKLEHQRIPHICASKPVVGASDLLAEGFPFFAGGMSLELRFDLPNEMKEAGRWLVRFPEASVAGMEIIVNSIPLGIKVWGVLEWDITGVVKNEGNIIQIRIVNTLRNVIGPHHLIDDEKLNFLRPDHFYHHSDWVDAYVLEPFGLGRGYVVFTTS